MKRPCRNVKKLRSRARARDPARVSLLRKDADKELLAVLDMNDAVRRDIDRAFLKWLQKGAKP